MDPAESIKAIFARYHRPVFIANDPLDRVLRHGDSADREVVGLLAATLAFGRVAQILASLDTVLARLGPQPAVFVREARLADLVRAMRGCRHRWVTGDELANLLAASGRLLRSYGSLGAAWIAARRPEDGDAHDTARRWVTLFDAHGLRRENALIPRPERGSASKRLHLYLRWMVRQDRVDPGGWDELPARLLFPLDVHMHRIGRALGFTRRRTADLVAVREVTAGFRQIDPADPVRFDFALTRPAINEGASFAEVCEAFAREARKGHPKLARRALNR